MTTEKLLRLPLNLGDKRYRFPIDELRAMAWHEFVRIKSGNATNYLLSETFGGGQTRWANYGKGRQPNDLLLKNVDLVIPGSWELYKCGPNGSKLWAALITRDARELDIIKKVGKPLEKDLVRFRMAAMTGRIPGMHALSPQMIFAYDRKLQAIKKWLCKELGERLSEKAFEILWSEIGVYKSKADYSALSEFIDSVSDCNTYSHESINQMLLEQEYIEIQMRGLQSKGAALEAESIITQKKWDIALMKKSLAYLIMQK